MPEISGTNIHSQVFSDGQDALSNYDKSAMPRFQGNDNVPIEANISPEKLVGALQKSASYGGDTGSESKQLLGQLANGGAWNISAGIHEGGLGGAAGGADPNKHITLSTGHHVQLNDKGELKKITGPGFSRPGPAPQTPSNTQAELNRLKDTHGLNDKQALAVKNRDPRESEEDAATRVKAGKQSHIADFQPARQRRG
jgi:hypothetical protein